MRDRIQCLKCGNFFYRNNKSIVCPTYIQKDSKDYYTKKISDLEAKLAEKNKETATLEVMLEEIKDDIKEMQELKIGEYQYDLTDEDARYSLKCELLHKDQDKISFAVEQLEIAQKHIKKNVNNFDDMNDCLCAIDNQIKQLKDLKNV